MARNFDESPEFKDLILSVMKLSTESGNYQKNGFSMTMTINAPLTYSGEVKGTAKQLIKLSTKDGSLTGTFTVDVTYGSDSVKAVINASGTEKIEAISIEEISLNGKALIPGTISNEVKNAVKELLSEAINV